ncbi:MAG TPA: sigma-54-dependent Fis family transcriptional regulator [Desulfobulbaceae bacterium]|nr:sigma-54-dependent Fis family transcriptional regulator [Desulfobulbaceae bacterium]HHD63025.1 sigma-54-dependent Fis family transcriptional regulator [Desulfobulbaceae bacterium]
MSSNGRVIVIDNDKHVCKAAGQALKLAGYSVDCCSSAGQSLSKISRQWPGVLVTDVKMPGMDGFALLHHVVRNDPDLPVILVTGHGDVSMAVEAMRQGAYDFIEKPLSSTHLIDVVGRAMEKRRLILDNRTLRAEVRRKNGLESVIVGRSKKTAKLREMIINVADTDTDVLIVGETGTGKELVARCLHEQSRRQDSRFVAVNCGAIPEAIIENELFGHEPGAYTGADRLHIGKFELADGGTLFLDEIESMPLVLQVRLLRVLQERAIDRLGGKDTIPLDLRIIAASKQDLLLLSEQGTFRSDLYYRLNVVTIQNPPLRQRTEDIPILYTHFLHKAAKRLERRSPELSPTLLHQLMQHSWPGNVRELQNAAERAVLGLDHSCEVMAESIKFEEKQSLNRQLAAFEKCILEQELARNKAGITKTCKSLGLPRKTLYYKMKKHGLQREDFL